MTAADELIPRGECTVFASDDELQPDGEVCSGRGVKVEDLEAPVTAAGREAMASAVLCDMCHEPCPDPHVHVYERAGMLDHPLPEEPQFGYTAAVWDELRHAVRHVGEQVSARPIGCCSEGCALRFVAGEPAVFERGGLERGEPGTAERDRYWRIRSRSLPSGLLDEG